LAADPDWTQWRREKFPLLSLPVIEPGRPAHSLVTTLTELPRFLKTYGSIQK